MSPRKFKAHPQSAPGDFYVVNGECITCGAPHAVAPNLVGWAENVEFEHCIWKRQPQTQQEIEEAIGAVLASEVACHRYAGNDPGILDRLDSTYCDASQPVQRDQAGKSCNDVVPPNFTLVVGQPSTLDRFLAALKSIFRS